MAQERSNKKNTCWHRLKNAFWPKKEEQKELIQSSQLNADDRPEHTTLLSDGDGNPGNTMVSNDQSNSRIARDEIASEEDISTTLWNRAYENMRDGKKKELIITYEKVLTKEAFIGKLFAFEFYQ